MLGTKPFPKQYFNRNPREKNENRKIFFREIGGHFIQT